MDILVTGGAGFIGSSLVERLLARGDRVVAFDNFNDFYDPSLKEKNIAPFLGSTKFELVRGDLRDRNAIDRCVRERRYDAVVHLAAMAGVRPSVKNPALYNDVNCLGTIHMLEALREKPETRFIFGSSSSVYGANIKTPFSETDNLEHMISPYAASKRAGEQYASCYHALFGIPVSCLRFFTVYGPKQRPEMAIAKFASLIERGEELPVFGDGTTRRDYTYIDDILDGLTRAIDKCAGYEVYNLGESRTVELRELIEILSKAIGRPAKIRRLPPEPGDVTVTYADIRKAKTQLGYNPSFPIEEGIRRYVEWRKSSL